MLKRSASPACALVPEPLSKEIGFRRILGAACGSSTHWRAVQAPMTPGQKLAWRCNPPPRDPIASQAPGAGLHGVAGPTATPGATAGGAWSRRGAQNFKLDASVTRSKSAAAVEVAPMLGGVVPPMLIVDWNSLLTVCVLCGQPVRG